MIESSMHLIPVYLLSLSRRREILKSSANNFAIRFIVLDMKYE